MILAEFPRERTAGVSSRSTTVTNKANSLTYTVASSLVCTSPLARHHHRRTPRCPHGLHLSRVKVSLADHMHTSSGIRYKLSLSSGSFADAAGEYPFFRGRAECSFVVLFELVYVFGMVPCLASGTSLLSFSLFMGPILEFHSAGSSLIRIFVLYFPSDGPFFSRIFASRSVRLSESYPSNWFQDFLHRVSPGLFSTSKNQCFRVLRDATQLWYNFHIIVVVFSSFLVIAAFLWLLV